MKEALIPLLGLRAEADESEILGVVSALKECNRSFLTIAAKDSAPESLGVIEAWKRSHEQLPAIQTELSELKNKTIKAEVEALFGAATSSGKVTPAMEASLRTARAFDCSDDIAWLRAHVEALPVVQQLGVQLQAPALPTLSDEEKRFARSLGLTEEKYFEHKASLAARDKEDSE